MLNVTVQGSPPLLSLLLGRLWPALCRTTLASGDQGWWITGHRPGMHVMKLIGRVPVASSPLSSLWWLARLPALQGHTPSSGSAAHGFSGSALCRTQLS